ncbi:MAG: ATP-dependent Clp protease proteolytic subunit [Methanobacterium sp.]
MGLMGEYIKKGLGTLELEKELLSLIKEYNEYKGNYLFVYASALNKSLPDIALSTDDYYIIYDMLRTNGNTNLDFYIETPGGNGTASEDIAEFLRSKFEKISFVISGEAKSAGTILALSGDEIYMTGSGSLGPIDAQVKHGRAGGSAYDYMEWINQKKVEAQKTGRLNPVDATMIAQISPAECKGVYNALKFAEDIVKKWLVEYKFKDWEYTETNHTEVTEDMKKKRAEKIAQELTKHGRWRTHGRSLKIHHLEDIGLKINKIDDDPELAEIVYKIQTVIKMLFSTTSAYKIFATEEDKLMKNAVEKSISKAIPQANQINGGKIQIKCERCGTTHEFYFKFVDDPDLEKKYQSEGLKPFPKDNKLKCSCGYEIDLIGIKNNIESNAGKKMIL